MVTPMAIPDNSRVTFDDFVSDAVKQLPVEDDWQRQICCAAFGLIAETTTLMHLTERWAMGTRLPARYVLLRQLGPLESYRALLCYHLHVYPSPVSPFVRVPPTLDAGMKAMVLRAGDLARAMQQWVSKGQWLDRRAVRLVQRFDEARGAVYGLLDVTPQQVWETSARPSSGSDLSRLPVPDALVEAVTGSVEPALAK